MYYPKLTYASSTIEGVFLFGILFLLNKIYGLESLYYIGNFQIIHIEDPNKSHWETPLEYIQKRRREPGLFSDYIHRAIMFKVVRFDSRVVFFTLAKFEN